MNRHWSTPSRRRDATCQPPWTLATPKGTRPPHTTPMHQPRSRASATNPRQPLPARAGPKPAARTSSSLHLPAWGHCSAQTTPTSRPRRQTKTRPRSGRARSAATARTAHPAAAHGPSRRLQMATTPPLTQEEAPPRHRPSALARAEPPRSEEEGRPRRRRRRCWPGFARQRAEAAARRGGGREGVVNEAARVSPPVVRGCDVEGEGVPPRITTLDATSLDKNSSL